MLHGKELRVHGFEMIGHIDVSVLDLSLMRFWFAMSQFLSVMVVSKQIRCAWNCVDRDHVVHQHISACVCMHRNLNC